MDDDGLGIFIALIVAWVAVIFFVVIPLAIASHNEPYCPVGQGTILDEDSNVTGCVILIPQPSPILAPGQVVPPMIGN